jgi:hypothetical protein
LIIDPGECLRTHDVVQRETTRDVQVRVDHLRPHQRPIRRGLKGTGTTLNFPV